MIIAGIVVMSLVIINQFQISARIYYTTTYVGNVQDFETIIEKSESFEDETYCKYHNLFGEVHNLSFADDFYYIDRTFLEDLKLKIKADKTTIHVYPFFSHNFRYSLEVTNESLIYLTYNNDSIIKMVNDSHTQIFTARKGHYNNGSLYWEENWYLNFT
jgi:hypothetical protein